MRKNGFTLVELLVVIGIVLVLIAIVVPSLAAARKSSQRLACVSNLRQIALTTLLYSNDSQSYFVPAHIDFYTVNNHRWHGTRADSSKPFDFATSPLRYLMQTARLKDCPSFVFNEEQGFERSCGGYGYNSAYIGSGMSDPTLIATPMPFEEFEKRAGNVPARQSQIARPSEKILFADTAIAFPSLIEYSFATAPKDGWGNSTSPSLHFRHNKFCNVAWVDGHVSSETMDWTYPVNIYGADNQKNRLGFFGPRDNRFFQRR
jgi:prepilin-type N-terminal cleavage/methylation domain-containing protein/prepilin-type processing-associated H-X9-DG protein